MAAHGSEALTLGHIPSLGMENCSLVLSRTFAQQNRVCKDPGSPVSQDQEIGMKHTSMPHHPSGSSWLLPQPTPMTQGLLPQWELSEQRSMSVSGPGASSTEQGTTGPSGLAERVVHTNCVGFLNSYAPAWDSIHAANRYCVCVCMLSTGAGRATGEHDCATCSGVRACRGP